MKTYFTYDNRVFIDGNMQRDEIVKTVVNTFIGFEYPRKAKGIGFKYWVENLSEERKLYIERPGRKKNFDFKVEVEEWHNLKKGSHEDIANDFKLKITSKPEEFKALWEAFTEIYTCKENDVDKILAKYPKIEIDFKGIGSDAEILLKVVKWFFVMEDIIYWDNLGRDFLYNFLAYWVSENNSAALEAALAQLKWDPGKLQVIMKRKGIPWTPSTAPIALLG